MERGQVVTIASEFGGAMGKDIAAGLARVTITECGATVTVGIPVMLIVLGLVGVSV